MKPSSSILGASRLPLTPKRGNKDFYKGTRQSFVPGGGHRTGPPGHHVVRGKAKYRLDDERVRVFVGPGPSVLQNTDLKPYVSTRVPSHRPDSILPSFSPNPQPTSTSQLKENGRPYLDTRAFNKFSESYQRHTIQEKEAIKLEARRKWWDAVVKRYPVTDVNGTEEIATRDLEKRAPI